MNFVHILQEQAERIAAVISRGRATGARVSEPTEAPEEGRVRTVMETASDTTEFQAECTPGYYNGEGTLEIAGSSFSPDQLSSIAHCASGAKAT